MTPPMYATREDLDRAAQRVEAAVERVVIRLTESLDKLSDKQAEQAVLLALAAERISKIEKANEASRGERWQLWGLVVGGAGVVGGFFAWIVEIVKHRP